MSKPTTQSQRLLKLLIDHLHDLEKDNVTHIELNTDTIPLLRNALYPSAIFLDLTEPNKAPNSITSAFPTLINRNNAPKAGCNKYVLISDKLLGLPLLSPISLSNNNKVPAMVLIENVQQVLAALILARQLLDAPLTASEITRLAQCFASPSIIK